MFRFLKQWSNDPRKQGRHFLLSVRSSLWGEEKQLLASLTIQRLIWYFNCASQASNSWSTITIVAFLEHSEFSWIPQSLASREGAHCDLIVATNQHYVLVWSDSKCAYLKWKPNICSKSKYIESQLLFGQVTGCLFKYRFRKSLVSDVIICDIVFQWT